MFSSSLSPSSSLSLPVRPSTSLSLSFSSSVSPSPLISSSKYKTDEQRRAHCPNDIDQEDWNWLINYWSDPKFKRVSEANKANRAKKTMIARVGTMSIARNIHNMILLSWKIMAKYLRVKILAPSSNQQTKVLIQRYFCAFLALLASNIVKVALAATLWGRRVGHVPPPSLASFSTPRSAFSLSSAAVVGMRVPKSGFGACKICYSGGGGRRRRKRVL
uniref:Uncharacterized protein n=1 Tax=Ananas comosus var. bracteatus TaxID=296719 RepID=A0A6V7PVC2_ANACO|nr:unnamed protein product [Ananas comosus var. bracteatus]